MVTVIGHIPGHIAYLALFVWSTYWSLSISVVADTDNIKDVLEVIEVSGLMVIWWKQAHPSDTEDEANVSLTSKDKDGRSLSTSLEWPAGVYQLANHHRELQSLLLEVKLLDRGGQIFHVLWGNSLYDDLRLSGNGCQHLCFPGGGSCPHLCH